MPIEQRPFKSEVYRAAAKRAIAEAQAIRKRLVDSEMGDDLKIEILAVYALVFLDRPGSSVRTALARIDQVYAERQG